MMSNELPFAPALKLLVVITDHDESKRLEDILREKHVHFHYMFNAIGTASSEILNAFGLSGTKKIVCICIEPAVKIPALLTAVVERLEFIQPGNGIAFTMPLTGASAIVSKSFEPELLQLKERFDQIMEKEAEKATQHSKCELVVSVINQGFSEVLMDAAKASGARGGTIINARRTGIEDAAKFFGISLQAEKEIVAIVINKSHKKELMQAISQACGLRTEAHGIVLSLPVESCAGISMDDLPVEE